ncbi:unnamed protein product [Durusdinium trenchii]|uniref:Exostosin GT47 domain-containing protein n=1 Tax=Durusdinium trenchii TaxID=1381693 RepID=A0ABP0PPU9_9DINO
MMLGCIPVLLFHPDSYPVLPFVSRLPWEEFALVMPIATEEEAMEVLERLLSWPQEDRHTRRSRTLRYAPLVALSLQHCPGEVISALHLISLELKDKVTLLQNALLPGVQVAPPAPKDDWLQWGPSRGVVPS